MAITAGMVKELREMTGAGMMDCKKALTATEGNMDAAVDWLREKGLAIPHVARDTICRIGYDKPESGFNGHTCAVLTACLLYTSTFYTVPAVWTCCRDSLKPLQNSLRCF